MRMLNGRTTPRWLAAVVVLQVVTLLTTWGAGPSVRPAAAQIPDAGAQQQAIIDQLKRANDQLDKLTDLLASGHLKVQVAVPERGR